MSRYQHLLQVFLAHTAKITEPKRPCVFRLCSALLQKVLFGGSCSSLHHMPLRSQDASFATALAGHAGTVTGCAVSSDGRLAVSTSQDGSAKVWDLVEGNLQSTYIGHIDSVNCVVLTHDNARAITGSNDNSIQLWNIDNAETLRELDGHGDWVYSVAISQDDQMLVSASADRTLRVWNLETGETLQLLTGHEGAVTCCAISPDGSRVVSGSRDKTTRVWDTLTGVVAAVFDGHSDWVLCCMLLSGSLVATGSADNTLKLWNIDDGEEVTTLTGHRNWVTTVSVTHDGKQLVSGAEDRTLKLWDLEHMVLQDSVSVKSVPRALAVPAAKPREQTASILATHGAGGFIWGGSCRRKLRVMAGNMSPKSMSPDSGKAGLHGSPMSDVPHSRFRLAPDQGAARSDTSQLTHSSMGGTRSGGGTRHGSDQPPMSPGTPSQSAAMRRDSSGFMGKIKRLAAAGSPRSPLRIGSVCPKASSPRRE